VVASPVRCGTISGPFRIKGFEETVRQLWVHALAAGLFGKEIARTHRRNIEAQYLCGLLHTIGKPVILQAAIDLQETLNLQLSEPMAEILMQDFHASVGSILTFSWGLPDIVSKTCMHYQHYDEATLYRDETIATYLSGQLARHLNDPEAVSEEDVRNDPAFQELNFYPEDIQQLFSHFDQIAELLNAMTL
jgi:HD-like signal output (HDOD) protein